ncbi:MerR family transcriptional regulator [Nocardia harenae]|uniref:MerR family transcriptional regulator n=1 Tax=Nocardia harenae TaxID=358707 RepID=UPI000832A974|nr:MerR family transcriptional regulator [Nocardia harenae]
MTGREYRIAELAEAASVPVRTVRYYQERGLIGAPGRRGRHAVYTEAHLERLGVIADLLDRGHSLDGIGELLAGAENGSKVSELLGFETAASTAWGDGEITIDFAQLLDRFGEQATPQAITEAAALGYLRVEDDHFVCSSGRLLDAATGFVAAGIPLRSVLALSWEMEAAFDRMAFGILQEFRTHLLDRVVAHPSPAELHELADTLERLRPFVRQVADEQLARAMDRRIQADLPEVSDRLHRTAEAGHPGGRQGPRVS